MTISLASAPVPWPDKDGPRFDRRRAAHAIGAPGGRQKLIIELG